MGVMLRGRSTARKLGLRQLQVKILFLNTDYYNKGPVGDAFATEFFPLLDRRFRINGGRVPRGHSSCEYAVVYLLMHYPKVFAGGNEVV